MNPKKSFLIILFIFFLLINANLALIKPLVFNQLSLHEKTDIIIELKDQIDPLKIVDPMTKSVITKVKNQKDRGYIVMQELMKVAGLSQGPIRHYLEANKIKYKAFWITNAIAAFDVTEKIVNDLNKMSQVATIEANIKIDPSSTLERPLPYHHKNESSSYNEKLVEWNVRWIKADKMWAKGFTGKGIVVAVSDTGVQHNHPALISSYKGNNGREVNHNYHWFDAVLGAETPADDNGHGTHCTGTISGGVDRKIGVAPGSSWINCRSFTSRQWSPATFIGCLQFFLAPTDVKGNNPDPSKRPHITSHSYGCDARLGCPDLNAMKAASDALRAAGVYMIVAAGNAGPSCASIRTQPGIYESVLAVAATDFNSDNLARFSSRGPITYDGSNRAKPELAAPGVRVLSSYPGSRYTSMSGTSMATPAVAGAIALLWEAIPELQRELDETLEIFGKTAKNQPSSECSSRQRVPNNLFGWGTIDVEAAYEEAKKRYKK